MKQTGEVGPGVGFTDGDAVGAVGFAVGRKVGPIVVFKKIK